MSDPQTILQATVAVCSVAAFSWGVIGVALRMSPRVSMMFILTNLLMAVSLVLTSWRGEGGHYLLIYPLADLLGLCSFASLRLGIHRFTHGEWRWRETALLLLPVMVLMLTVDYLPASKLPALSYSLIAAIFSALTLHDAWRGIGGSLLRVIATHIMLSPILAVFVLFAGRFLLVSAGFGDNGESMSTGSFNTIFLFSGMILALAINIALIGLVTQRLVDRLRLLSQTDPMTGVLNRRELAKQVQKMQQRQLDAGDDYALCIVDVDHFKAINDRYGHAAGDAALLHLVAMITDGIRAEDLLARLGGEEFCMVLPDTTLEEAGFVAQRLCDLVASQPLQWEGNEIPLTISVGVTVGAKADHGTDALYRRADIALYRAKNAGRNCVMLAPVSCET